MICKKCGQELTDGSRFCPFCGTDQTANAEQTNSMDPAANQQYDTQQNSTPQYDAQQYGTPQYDAQQYNTQQYGNQPYGSQQYGSQQYSNQPYGSQQYSNQMFGVQQPAQPAYPGYQQPGQMYNGYQNPVFSPEGQAVMNTAIQKVETCATLWLVIGIVQIVLGLVELCVGYGIAVIIIGIWNIVQSRTVKKNAAYFRTNPRELPAFYDTQRTKTIIFIFVNFFLGSVVGVIASIYELLMENYIRDNRQILTSL